MNPSIIVQARSYVKRELLKEGTGHDWWHIYRVSELAKQIAAHEGANRYICELAALFHDLADEKIVESKAVGLQHIAQWLEDHEVDSADITQIIEIIATMSYNGGHGEPMSSLEGKVVQDADRLDAIGAIGIARTFVYAGAKGHPIYDPEIPPRDQMTVEQYRNGENTAVNHFYEKLLKLKSLLNTDCAKVIADQRHQFMEQFLHQFYKEWNVQEHNMVKHKPQ